MSELNVYELLNRKRRGAPLEPREIETFIDRYTRGEIPDYQMSAMLIAVAINGMTAEGWGTKYRWCSRHGLPRAESRSGCSPAAVSATPAARSTSSRPFRTSMPA